MDTKLRAMINALRDVNVDSPHHPEVNQFNHTVQVARHARDAVVGGEVVNGKDFLLAAVLHDVGKATSMARNGTMHGHEGDSVKMLEGHVNEDVLWLIANHIRIIHLDEMRASKQKALREHRLFDTLVTLRRCDKAGRDGTFEVTADVEKDFEGILQDIGI